MKQMRLGLGTSKMRTRRRELLDEMDRLVPWTELVTQISSFMPGVKRGRSSSPIDSLLYIHFMQKAFTQSDLATEWELSDMPSLRDFSGLGDRGDRLRDESTGLHFFLYVQETQYFAECSLAEVNHLFGTLGLMLCSGAVFDATLNSALSSTKYASGEHIPKKKQSLKSQRSYFGVKPHIEVVADSGRGHTVRGKSGSVIDEVVANSLLHGQETDVFADAAYQGVYKRPDDKGHVPCHVAMRPGLRKLLDKADPMQALTNQIERVKVVQPFWVIKRQFSHVKMRYRGMPKNTAQLHTLFALSNLWMVRKRLCWSVS